jgi:predicted RNA-binding protein YlxR (DUF448 family)
MAKGKQQRSKHVPLRTCVVCRQKTDKRRLTRIVRTADSGVVVDLTGKRNGRGAYLCDQPACWEKAIGEIGLLNRVLRTQVSEAERAGIASYGPGIVSSE